MLSLYCTTFSCTEDDTEPKYEMVSKDLTDSLQIGVLFILRHLSLAAFTAFIWSAVFAIVGVTILSFVGLMIYAGIKVKAEERAKSKQGASTVDASTASSQGTDHAPVKTNEVVDSQPLHCDIQVTKTVHS